VATEFIEVCHLIFGSAVAVACLPLWKVSCVIGEKKLIKQKANKWTAEKAVWHNYKTK